MSIKIKRPNRGKLLTLWNLLEPDKGYSRLEIEDIAKTNDLDQYTATNLLHHGVKNEYVFLQDNSYYRSDSIFPPQVSINGHIDSAESQEFDIYETENKIRQDWRELIDKAKQRKEEIIKQKQKLEEEEKVLNSKIDDWENYLKQINNL